MNEFVDFESEIPWEKVEILLGLGNEYGFDPLSSIESEKFFKDLISKYNIKEIDFLDLLRKDIEKLFKVIDKKPEWIQDPEWQFNNGKPMEFIGQLDIKKNKIGLHDDVAFYVFWDRDVGKMKTIMQIG